MPLSCYCDDDDAEWYWFSPPGYVAAPQRRKRCKSCGDLIGAGATAAEYQRARGPSHEIEERIYGAGPDIPMASWWLCERCADIAFSLEDLGFCVSPCDDMREMLREYQAAAQKVARPISAVALFDEKP